MPSVHKHVKQPVERSGDILSPFHHQSVPCSDNHTADMGELPAGITPCHTYQHESDSGNGNPFERDRAYKQQMHTEIRHQYGCGCDYGYHTCRRAYEPAVSICECRYEVVCQKEHYRPVRRRYTTQASASAWRPCGTACRTSRTTAD